MEAVLLVGIQGAGKSTFYRERFFDTHVRINLDMLRTRARERILLEACLRARQPLVVDNTNVRASERAVYIAAAKAAGFRVACYFFVPDVPGSMARNRAREGKKAVPAAGVLGTLKRLEAPRMEEGLDALYLVRALPEGRFAVEAAG
jgi:predicted kinase